VTVVDANIVKKSQTFAAYTKSYSKAFGSKAFTLDAKLKTGDGKLTYTSSNKKVVTVDAKGKVTIVGTGYAAITVKAAATAKYNAKSIKITIKVKPKKQTISGAKSDASNDLTVKWKKDTTSTGYQVQYAADNKFTDAKTVTVSKNSTVSTTIKKLTSGKVYYVRLRAYKTATIDGKATKLYSTWSAVVKTEKIK
jgi:hypothetical protein